MVDKKKISGDDLGRETTFLISPEEQMREDERLAEIEGTPQQMTVGTTKKTNKHTEAVSGDD